MIYQAIPLSELTKSLKIRKSKKGPDAKFSLQGMLALMFIKSYAGCSDNKLITHIAVNMCLLNLYINVVSMVYILK
jgi:hypothetical protein